MAIKTQVAGVDITNTKEVSFVVRMQHKGHL